MGFWGDTSSLLQESALFPPPKVELMGMRCSHTDTELRRGTTLHAPGCPWQAAACTLDASSVSPARPIRIRVELEYGYNFGKLHVDVGTSARVLCFR